MNLLSHPDWEHKIILDDGSSTLLVLEDQMAFRSYLSDLFHSFEGNGPFYLSDGLKEKKIKDHIDIILSPYSISFTEKRLTTKLQTLLKEHVTSENLYEETMSVITTIEKYAENVSFDFPTAIAWDSVDVAGLLKIIGFSIQAEYETDFEKVLEYMNVMHDICGIDDFVLVSFFTYFSLEEINSLISDATANKHNILFLESSQPLSSPKETKLIIVDKDRCEIY